MAQKPTDDKVKIQGVGLKLSEWEQVKEIAKAMQMKPHAVAQFAIRFFLKAWKEGKVKTETRKTFPDL